MATNFEYDESGDTFLYFILAFIAFIVIPLTWWNYRRCTKKPEKRKVIECHCEGCEEKFERQNRTSPYEKYKNYLVWLVIAIGWILFLFVGYKAVTTVKTVVEWNPFDVLGLDSGATKPQIKKAYRDLSLKHHPDRGGEEETFVKISKAYKALTDDEARKNWEMYGNPDGPGVMTFGIALPSWIVDKQYSFWVLAVYLLVFMVGMPIAVTVWWNRSNKYSNPDVMLLTQKHYYHFLAKCPSMDIKRIIMVLSSAAEYQKAHNPLAKERETDDESLCRLMRDMGDVGNWKTKEPPFNMPPILKARILMYAHMCRSEMPSNESVQDMEFTVKYLPILIQALLEACWQLMMHPEAYGIPRPPTLETMENIMKLSPIVVQALQISNSRSPLLQLPHIEKVLKHFITKKRRITTISAFLKLEEEDRRSLVRDLTDDEYMDVMTVAKVLPRVEVNVNFLVLDEKDQTVTAKSVVTAVITLKRWNLIDWINEGKDKEFDNGFDDLTDALAPSRSGAKGYKGKGGKKFSKVKNNNAPRKNKVSAATSGKENVRKSVDASPKKSPKASKRGDGGESSADESNDEDELDNRNASDEDSDVDKDIPEELREKPEKIVPEGKSKMSHPVHCPFFNEEKQEWWWLYICDTKTKKFPYLAKPQLVTDLGNTDDAVTVKIRFLAPEKPGNCNLKVVLHSDSYIGCDVVKNETMAVNPAKIVDENHPQWDISESEEEQNDTEDELASETDSE